MKNKLVKLISYGIIAVLSFCICARYIGIIIDHYHVGADHSLQKKIIHLKQSEEKFRIIFAGSSHIYRSIKPKVFTEYLKSHGFKFNGYSLSAPGSYAFEIHHYLNILKKFPPQKRPEYLIINLFPITPDYIIEVVEENKLNNRMINYHDTNTTYLNIKALIYSNKTLYEKYQAISNHLIHFFYNFANIGMGKYFDRMEYRLSDYEHFFISDNYGYTPELKGKRSHKDGFSFKVFSDMIARYKKSYDKMIKEKLNLNINNVDLMFRTYQVNSLRKSRIKVIFAIPPVLYDMSDMHALCETESFPVCFSMDDPYKYPELFEYENRYDQGHLNDVGAEYYSKFLAQRFIEYIESGQ